MRVVIPAALLEALVKPFFFLFVHLPCRRHCSPRDNLASKETHSLSVQLAWAWGTGNDRFWDPGSGGIGFGTGKSSTVTITPPTGSTSVSWAPKTPPSPVESQDRNIDPVHWKPNGSIWGAKINGQSQAAGTHRAPLPQLPWWDVLKSLTQSISWGAGVMCDS